MSFKINVEKEGDRLDIFLLNQFDDKSQSRNQVQKLIKEGNILVNGKKKKSNYIVKINDLIDVEIPEKEENLSAENIDIEIIYEDDDLAVVYKPQGMVVHPGDGNRNGTLVNALLYHLDELSDLNDENVRPGIVHRIDKDTSGILLIAKNNEAHKIISAELKEHSIKRQYIALVEGIIEEEEGKIDAPIGRNPKNRKKMAVIEDGKRAVTHFKVLKRFKDKTLIRAQLETGRTHQIRVHMRYINHPLVGDLVYGRKKQKYKLKGQLLHAYLLGFDHPRKKRYMEFKYPLPDYFEDILQKLEKENIN